METDISERYKKIQDRFNLPLLADLKNAFTFEIEDSNKLIDQIRVEISERVFALSEKVIEPIIGSADTFSNLFEQDMFDENEREKLFRLYKKVQALKWENNLLAIRPNDKLTAQWIRKTWDFWNNELSRELAEVCRKMAVNWQDMKFKNENTVYHG
jgi:hypothetical protein